VARARATGGCRVPISRMGCVRLGGFGRRTVKPRNRHTRGYRSKSIVHRQCTGRAAPQNRERVAARVLLPTDRSKDRARACARGGLLSAARRLSMQKHSASPSAQSTTLSGGSLGSHVDEERSQLRYAMWTAGHIDHRHLERTLWPRVLGRWRAARFVAHAAGALSTFRLFALRERHSRARNSVASSAVGLVPLTGVEPMAGARRAY